jgi:hypothetical protein
VTCINNASGHLTPKVVLTAALLFSAQKVRDPVLSNSNNKPLSTSRAVNFLSDVRWIHGVAFLGDWRSLFRDKVVVSDAMVQCSVEKYSLRLVTVEVATSALS